MLNMHKVEKTRQIENILQNFEGLIRTYVLLYLTKKLRGSGIIGLRNSGSLLFFFEHIYLRTDFDKISTIMET